MHRKSSAINNTGRLGLGKTATLGLVTALAFFVLSGAVALYITHHLRSSNDRVIQTHQVIVAVDQLLLDIQNAETGQRGYLLTGDEKYLEPYTTALSRLQNRMSRVGGLIAGDSVQLDRFRELQGVVAAKFRIMEETVATFRTQGQAAAVAEENSDVGIEAMDNIRALIAQVRDAENEVRTQRIAEMGNAFAFAMVVSVLTGLLPPCQ